MRFSNNSIIWLLIGALLLGLAALALNRGERGSDEPASSLKSQTRPAAAKASADGRENARRKQARTRAGNESNKRSRETEERTAALVELKDAYEYRRSIVSALDETVRAGVLTQAQMMRNVLGWEILCNPKRRPITEHQLTEFCQDFSGEMLRLASESYDLQQSNGGPAVIKSLREETGLSSSGAASLSDPEFAVQAAIRALVDALDRLDYAAVQEIIWFMGHEFSMALEHSASERQPPPLSSDPEVLVSVAVATFCEKLRNCDGDHTVTLWLCAALEHRSCQDPSSFEDAVRQVLTVSEVDAFISMFNWIQALISRHRAGAF